MAPLERTTYFAYNEGIDPTLLRTGSLVFDYANPRTRRPYYHQKVDDLLGDPRLATSDQRPLCSMGRSDGKSNAFSFGLEGLLEFGQSRAEVKSRLVIGKNGSKVELSDPEAFFKSHVLKEETARLWLETRLSVANTLQRAFKNAFDSPKIWMLTGIYYMEDATVYHVRSKSSETSASGTIPIPEPTGMVQLLGVNPGMTVSFGKTVEGQAIAQITGERVWAAQWTQVGAKYFDAKGSKQQVDLAINQLKLLNVWSVGTERWPGSQERIAELSIVGSPRRDAEDAAPEYNEDMWKEFEHHLNSLLEDLDD